METIGRLATAEHGALPRWREAILRRAVPPAFVAGVVLANLPVVVSLTPGTGTALFVVCYTALAGGVALIQRPGRLAYATMVVLAGLGLCAQILLLLWAGAHDGFMDRDDALTFWWSRLGSGQNPYAGPTALGNPISVLPTLHLLALPFIVLGNVGYLMIAASAGSAVLAWRRYHAQPAIRIAAVIAATSAPTMLLDAMGRSDLGANMLLFVGVLLWVERLRADTAPPTAWFGLTLGFLAATRIAIWPALAIPVVALVRPHGLSATLRAVRWAVISFVPLTLPFFLWNPANYLRYAPLGVNGAKLGSSHAAQLLSLALCAVAVVLGCVYTWRGGHLVPSALPILAVAAASTWATFDFDASYAQLVVMPLIFAVPCARFVAPSSPCSESRIIPN